MKKIILSFSILLLITGNVFSAGSSSSDRTEFYLATDGTFAIYKDVSGSSANLSSTRIFRDENAWYHFVIQNNNGTVTVYVNNETVSLSGSNLGTNKINAASTAHYVGQQVAGGQNFFGMISHLHFVTHEILLLLLWFLHFQYYL